MDRLFLDANVLFSAAYRAEAGVARLWKLPGVVLLTSAYAVEEALRNLSEPHQRERLHALIESMTIHHVVIVDPRLRGEVRLPEKDWPILAGAAAVQATHLLTGDQKHFGPYFGERILGVLVLTPGKYL